MSHLKVQLQNFKSRVGVKLEVEDNGRLLHLRAPIGGFNEWIPLTYNLQVLREVIDQNIKLRKEVQDLMGDFVKLILVRCNVLKPEHFMTFPACSGGKQVTWWAWLLAILSSTSQLKIQQPGTYFPCWGNQNASESSEITSSKASQQLQVQLQNFKSRIGVKPEVEENGRLLHLRSPIGGFNEWIALTYNLQVLQDIISENIKLRLKIFDLIGTFLKLILIQCNVLRAEQCATFPVGSGNTSSNQASWWVWVFSALCPELQLPGLGVSFPNLPGFPNPVPPCGPFPNNQAAFWQVVAALMNSGDTGKPGTFPPNVNLPGNPPPAIGAPGEGLPNNQAAMWQVVASLMNSGNYGNPGTTPPNFYLPGNPPPGLGAPGEGWPNNQAALWQVVASLMNSGNYGKPGTSPPNVNLPGNPLPGIGAPGEGSPNNQAALWQVVASLLNSGNYGKPGTTPPNVNLPGNPPADVVAPGAGSPNNQAGFWQVVASLMNSGNYGKPGTSPPIFNVPGNPPLGIGAPGEGSPNNQAALWQVVASLMNSGNYGKPGTTPPNLNLPGNPPAGVGAPGAGSPNNQAGFWQVVASLMNSSNSGNPGTVPPNHNLPGPGTPCPPNPTPGSGAPGGGLANDQASFWQVVASMNSGNTGKPGTFPPNFNLPDGLGTPCPPNPSLGIGAPGWGSPNNQVVCWPNLPGPGMSTCFPTQNQPGSGNMWNSFPNPNQYGFAGCTPQGNVGNAYKTD